MATLNEIPSISFMAKLYDEQGSCMDSAEEMHATYTNTAVNNLRRLIKKTRLDIISIVYIRDLPVPNHWEEPTYLIIEHDCKGSFQRVGKFLVHILKKRNSNIYIDTIQDYMTYR